MSSDDQSETAPGSKKAQMGDKVYAKNVEFWVRAWASIKTPYTQMPKLSYLPDIPQNLEGYGLRKILDLGCGSGWLSVYLARLGFSVTGVDIASQAIELAKTWAKQENLSIEFSVADIVDMDFPEGTFDAVVANAIFEHLTFDLAKECLSKIERFLIPGGVFVGCFDRVGGGPGEYYELADGTHVYTDKGRLGMLLRFFDDNELKSMFADWTIDSFETEENGTRVIWARKT